MTRVYLNIIRFKNSFSTNNQSLKLHWNPKIVVVVDIKLLLPRNEFLEFVEILISHVFEKYSKVSLNQSKERSLADQSLGVNLNTMASFFFCSTLRDSLIRLGARNSFISFPEDCRLVKMNPSVHNFFLESHVFTRLEIGLPSACEVNCFMDADCVSYNLRQPQDLDGRYLCELSDSTDKIHPLDVKFEEGAVYKSFRVRWYFLLCHYK